MKNTMNFGEQNEQQSDLRIDSNSIATNEEQLRVLNS
jgi:hypothetical protein